jgi:hypothetical protein
MWGTSAVSRVLRSGNRGRIELASMGKSLVEPRAVYMPEFPPLPRNVRCLGQTGKLVLVLSFTVLDPKRTSGATGAIRERANTAATGVKQTGYAQSEPS